MLRIPETHLHDQTNVSLFHGTGRAREATDGSGEPCIQLEPAFASKTKKEKIVFFETQALA